MPNRGQRCEAEEKEYKEFIELDMELKVLNLKSFSPVCILMQAGLSEGTWSMGLRLDMGKCPPLLSVINEIWCCVNTTFSLPQSLNVDLKKYGAL